MAKLLCGGRGQCMRGQAHFLIADGVKVVVHVGQRLEARGRRHGVRRVERVLTAQRMAGGWTMPHVSASSIKHAAQRLCKPSPHLSAAAVFCV